LRGNLTVDKIKRHPIFISYASADDEVAPGQTEGWVTTLVKYLRVVLERKLGRQRQAELRMSRSSPPHETVRAPSDSVRESDAFLTILSPAYIGSNWCLDELQAFHGGIKDREAQRRTFVIEADPVDRALWPDELRDVRGYRFFEGIRRLGFPRPDVRRDPRYFDLLNDVAQDLATQLKNPETDVAARTEATLPALFLAEATDDLDPLRERLRRHLDQRGIPVAPQAWYPRDPAGFQAAALADMAHSRLFVQLLSEFAGKKSVDLPGGYLGLQLQLARAQGLPVQQWRSPSLDTHRIDDSEHRNLLEGPEVMTAGFEEFTWEVVRRWQKLMEPPGPADQPALEHELFVFVNATPADMHLAQEISRGLAEQRVATALPLSGAEPELIRRDLVENLTACDNLVLVHAKAPIVWIRSQLREARKVSALRAKSLPVCVFEGEGSEEDAGAFFPGLRVIDGRAGLNERKLRELRSVLLGEVQ
jgi:hypothetical protein